VSTSSKSSPAYLALAGSGELRRRAAEAVQGLAKCHFCPRDCVADRAQDHAGLCQGRRHARVASYAPHHGEEDCLRGRRGSGTIFFSGCNLGCVFCQNWEISHDCEGEVVPPERLAEMMLELQTAGCHNINWVTPSHVVPQALEALALAAERGLRLPIVYNTGAYDSMESLRLLDGVVDIYMPDFKFWNPAMAGWLAKARDYPEVARRVIREMHRQVGDLVLDEDGIGQHGLLVRHLVMPDGLAGTREIVRWLATEISPDTYINVMAQYHPAGTVTQPDPAQQFRELRRGITAEEFRAAMDDARAAGLRRFDQRRQ
jgi:putative pyruvate formate lyase activating enzyme